MTDDVAAAPVSGGRAPFPVLLAAPASFVFGAGLLAPGALAARLALWCVMVALGMRWTFTRAVRVLTINGG